MGKLLNLDANESAFLTKQLTYVKKKEYNTKYKTLKAFMLFPVSTEVPSGAKQIEWRIYSGVGFAKVISDYAHDLPRVDVYGEEQITKVKILGASYGWGVYEIRSAKLAGIDLNPKRANMARRAIEQKHNAIAFEGDSVHNIQGFLDYPGINAHTVPAGASTFKTWSTKTADEILADLNGIVATITDITNGVEAPDTIILPLAQYRIATTKRIPDTDITVLKFFLDNNQIVKNVEWVAELKDAGGSGVDRYMAYSKTPEHLTLELPTIFESHEAEKQGLEFKVPCTGETAGIIVYYPLSVAYGDGI